jgi:hypothetical protein
MLNGEVFERDAPLFSADVEGEVTCAGESFVGRVVELQAMPPPARGLRVRIRVEDLRRRLRAGEFAVARFRFAASKLEGAQRVAIEHWRNHTTAELVAAKLGNLTGVAADAHFPSLLDMGIQQALMQQGLTLTVPESAVIATGTKQVAYLERMKGMFDAVEVRVGRRCGDYFPVQTGLEFGQRVVTVGAVLLDAETRLNPNVAAGYFGAGSRPSAVAPPPPPGTPEPLSPEEKLIAQKQSICPVTKKPLDSMGGPVRVNLNGRLVFICCDGCEDRLRQQPGKYLSNLPK